MGKCRGCLLFLWVFMSQSVLANQSTEWFALFIADKKSGYMSIERQAEHDKVITKATTQIILNRIGTEIKIKTVQQDIESSVGVPLGFKMSMQGVGMSQSSSGVIKDGFLHVTTHFAGVDHESKIPWVPGVLMSEGLEQKFKSLTLTEGLTFQVKSFMPDSLLVVDVEIIVGKTDNVDLLGRVVPLTKITSNMNVKGVEIQSIAYVDQQGKTLKTVMPMMGTRIEVIATDKNYALSNDEPSTFFSSLFVKSPQFFSKKQLNSDITYVLSSVDDNKALVINKTDEQTIIQSPKKETIVQVKTSKIPNLKSFKYHGKDPAILAALAPNKWVQSDDPKIIALALKASKTVGKSDNLIKAIEAFVFRYIVDKNLSVGYASAVEVANSQQGDCTEHAVLATALYQALGIPARVVVGIVYVNQLQQHQKVFVPHAWTQVYIDGRWYSIDAALGKFDAGHIALQVGNGEPAMFYESVINTLGNIKMSTQN